MGETRRRENPPGTYGFWGLVGFLVAVYFVNVPSPPPPSVGAVAWGTQAMWLLVIWGYWVDRHRRPLLGAARA